MNKLKIIKEICKKLNTMTTQYEDGHFSDISLYKKEKDKPNTLYDFNLSYRYCKCCDVLFSIHFDINNKIYYWSSDLKNENNNIVNFKNNNIEFIVISFEEIIEIIKENIKC